MSKVIAQVLGYHFKTPRNKAFNLYKRFRDIPSKEVTNDRLIELLKSAKPSQRTLKYLKGFFLDEIQAEYMAIKHVLNAGSPKEVVWIKQKNGATLKNHKLYMKAIRAYQRGQR